MNFQIVIKTGTQIFNWISFQHTHMNTNTYMSVYLRAMRVSMCVRFSIDMYTTNIQMYEHISDCT